MLTRRKLIMGAVATALVGSGGDARACARRASSRRHSLRGFRRARARPHPRPLRGTAAGTATTGTTADTATRRTSTAATGLRNITASRRRSPRSARSRIRIPATGTMTTMMTTTVAARTTVRRPRLHLTGDDGSRGARSWRTGPSGDFKKAATPTRSACLSLGRALRSVNFVTGSVGLGHADRAPDKIDGRQCLFFRRHS